MRHYPFIDLLRGIAALWVCVAHCLIWTGVPLPGVASPKLAVDLFMMISGFLMMAQVSTRQAAEPMSEPRNWLRFYARRYFRIAPAYYLSLAVAVLGSTWFLGGYGELRNEVGGWLAQAPHLDPKRIDYDVWNLLAHLTFVFGLHPQASFSTFLPDWSLSLEMQFYLLFPLLFLACRRWGWIKVSLVSGLIGLLSVVLWYRAIKLGWLGPERSFLEPSLILMKLQFFLIGIGLFELVGVTDRRTLGRGIAVLGVLCLFQTGYGALRLFIFMLALLMLVLARSQHPGLQRLLGWPVVHRLSDSAYSVYLFHGFFIAMAGYGFAAELVAQPWLMVAWVVPAALLWAQWVERWVERPGIELGRRVIGRLPKAPVRSAAGA